MKMRKMLCILLCFVLMTGAIPSAFALEENRQTYIRDMLNDYRENRSVTSDTIHTSLEALSQLDPDQGEAWRRILETWHWVNESMELHYGMLPSGLPEDDSFAIVVMGFALNDDGTMQEELYQRLFVALDSARKYPNAYVICTGGGTASRSKQTEAEAMAAWLIAHGVAKKRVIVENRSYSTAQNALYTYEILAEDYPGIRSIAVVTSDYHIYRSYMNFVTVFDHSAAKLGTEAIEVVAQACCWPGYDGYESISSQAYDIAAIVGVDLNPEEKKEPTFSTWPGSHNIAPAATQPTEAVTDNWEVEPLIPGEVVFDW